MKLHPSNYWAAGVIALTLVMCFTCGCVNIPKGSVEEYHRTTTVLTVTSKADLTGIKSTGKTVRAEDATFSLSFPGFYSVQTVKGLILSVPPPEKP